MTRAWFGDLKTPPGRSIVAFTGVVLADTFYRLAGRTPLRYLWAALENALIEFDDKAKPGIIDYPPFEGEDDHE